MLRYLIPIGLFGTLIAFFFVGLGRDKQSLPSPLIGKPAQYSLPRVDDPTQLASEKDFAGQVYLLNVWGPWCVACRAEHHVLLEIARRNVVPILGFTVPEGAMVDANDQPLPMQDVMAELELAQRWLRELGDPYRLSVFDQTWKTAIDLGVYGAPETFLIDGRGIIRHKHTGPLDLAVWERDFMPKVNQYRSAGG